MTTDSWDEALDALEEWLRRTAAELAGDGPEAPAVALPTTPVPEGLRLRATALLQRMGDLEVEAMQRRTSLERARAYQH